jgi:phage tail-like protein
MIDRAPHFLLDSHVGWRVGALDKATLSHGDLVLQPLPGSVRPLTDSFGGLQNAEGVAVDSQDRVYLLDSSACVVKRFDRCTGEFHKLPCIGRCGREPRHLNSPRGLAISCSDNLYIADSGNRRVQIFSIHGLALRRIWEPLQVLRSAKGIAVKRSVATLKGACTYEYPEGTWMPWDIAITNKNWAYVSDYANGLIHVFDPRGCWRTAYEGKGPQTPALVKPTRLAIDRQGRVYVIQEGLNYVVVLDGDGKFLGNVEQPSDIAGNFCPVAVASDVHGNLCLSCCLTQKIYFYQPDGDGGWCKFRCCGSTAGFAESMVFDHSGKTLFANGDCGLCELSPEAAFPLTGQFYSAALDSKTYRCVWDRVLMRGTVPAGAALRVDTFTSESEKQPDEILSLPESRWSTGQIHTGTADKDWDCMIQSPPGRYCWLRLTLMGDGSVSPEIEKVKIYYPRSSSIKYLPAVYRTDPNAGDFLDRFLSIFDTLRGKTNGTITDIGRYFDPCATPANRPGQGPNDFLAWLAQWLGMTLKNGWAVEKRRTLLKNAHLLYALRGTPEGLRLHIRLYAGVEPRILEMFRLRRWLALGQSTLGNNSTVSGESLMNRLQIGANSIIGGFQLIDYGDPKLDLFNKYAHQFLVVVPRWPGAGPADRQSLEQIIEMAKPAHTVAQFQWARPRLRIGLQTLVGIDTVIGKYPVGVIEGQGKLGYDTVLGRPGENPPRPAMEVGHRSTIGCNSVLM